MFPEKGSWEECKLLINQLLKSAKHDIETIKKVQHEYDTTIKLNKYTIQELKDKLRKLELSMESNYADINTTMNELFKKVDDLRIANAVHKTKLAMVGASGGGVVIVIQKLIEKLL